MILLDTNVISELMKPFPHAKVEIWLDRQLPSDCFVSAVTEAELRYGIEILPLGQRRQQFGIALNGMLAQDFAGRILAFDSAAALMYATIAADRRTSGRPISQFDAQIAAIARSVGATLATRNVADFQGCGISIVDPWG
jgi:predicted nucleic acid-binding protein